MMVSTHNINILIQCEFMTSKVSEYTTCLFTYSSMKIVQTYGSGVYDYHLHCVELTAMQTYAFLDYLGWLHVKGRFFARVFQHRGGRFQCQRASSVHNNLKSTPDNVHRMRIFRN